MPQYGSICHDCHKGFSKVLFQDDYEEGTLTRPYCGGDRVEMRAAGSGTRKKEEECQTKSSAAGLESRQRKTIQAATVTAVEIGTRASTTVPLPLELISSVPLSCRNLSRIPLMPTPGVPVDTTSSSFSLAMPLRDPPPASKPRRQAEKREFSRSDCRSGGECW